MRVPRCYGIKSYARILGIQWMTTVPDDISVTSARISPLLIRFSLPNSQHVIGMKQRG